MSQLTSSFHAQLPLQLCNPSFRRSAGGEMPVAFRLRLLRRSALLCRRQKPGVAHRVEVKQPPVLQAQVETQKARMTKHAVTLLKHQVTVLAVSGLCGRGRRDASYCPVAERATQLAKNAARLMPAVHPMFRANSSDTGNGQKGAERNGNVALISLGRAGLRDRIAVVKCEWLGRFCLLPVSLRARPASHPRLQRPAPNPLSAIAGTREDRRPLPVSASPSVQSAR